MGETGAERLIRTGNNTTLCIDEFGDPDAPLVLQLEGHMAQTVSIPASYCQAVADHGFRVVRVDHRDVGRSQRFPATAYTLVDMMADLHGLLQVLKAPAVVCGRSMGGAIAQLLALHHPEDVTGLGLFFTFAKDGPPTPTTAPSVPRFADEAAFTAWEHASLPGIAGPDHPFTPAFIDNLAHTLWVRGVDPDGYDRQRRAMDATPGWAHRLSEITIPVAIVHGADDPVVAVHRGQQLAELIPHSLLTVVPGMGHQQPAALDEVFVKATLAAAGR